MNFTQSLSYQYDAAGRVQQVTYPSGTQIATTYGADGRPSELRVNGNALISNITYHPFGEPKSWTWGNGQAYTRSFDLDGRLKTHPIGSDIRTLTFDDASRITQTTEPIRSITARNMTQAALCGASPLQASSGKTTRHRLNRGGDRSANNALWTIAMVRMRSEPRIQAYVMRVQHKECQIKKFNAA